MSDIKLGDIIRTYHKGFWRLIKIERRFLTKDDLRYEAYKNHKVGDEYSPMFVYEFVMSSDFKVPKTKKPKQNSCDASYCKKVTAEEVTTMKQIYTDGCDRLAALL